VTVFGYTECRCGHPQSVHVIDHKGGRDGCYGLDERPKGKMPAWQNRLCGCPGYRTAWPNTTGTAECVDCGIEFTWRGRHRAFCPKCERRCPHCHAYCRGGTHCDTCGKCRGLSTAEFAQELPRCPKASAIASRNCSAPPNNSFYPARRTAETATKRFPTRGQHYATTVSLRCKASHGPRREALTDDGFRRSALSDAADRLAQALRDLINETLAAANDQPPSPPPLPAEMVPRRRLLTIDEARRELGGISRTTFYALTNNGQLTTLKIGRRTFVAASELDAFIERRLNQDHLTPGSSPP
jgi:excisionase family DNA binding protein